MAKGYLIAHIDVRDTAAYQTYLIAINDVFGKHGGRYLVRAGQFESIEGANRSRHVVVEFPSYQAALDCYHAPETAKVMAVRHANAASNLIIVEGYDGPQPSG